MDLTKNKIVFGELPKDVQDALRALPKGQVQMRMNIGWVVDSNPTWEGIYTYRQNPAVTFTEVFAKLPSGTVFQVGERRYVKYHDADCDANIRQLEAPYHACWFRADTRGWRGINEMEGFTPDKLTEDDITIVSQPKRSNHALD